MSSIKSRFSSTSDSCMLGLKALSVLHQCHAGLVDIKRRFSSTSRLQTSFGPTRHNCCSGDIILYIFFMKFSSKGASAQQTKKILLIRLKANHGSNYKNTCWLENERDNCQLNCQNKKNRIPKTLYLRADTCLKMKEISETCKQQLSTRFFNKDAKSFI